jgi:DNA polymerase II small subunit/DNA polymerase delta subunit B
MVQTKQPIFYEDRGDKQSIVIVEIDSYTIDKDGYLLTVKDYVLIDNFKVCRNTKIVRYFNEQIDQLSEYIDANFDLSGLSKTAKDWKKIQIGLLIDTTTNLLSTGKTIYRLEPTDWEITPDIIIEEPIIEEPLT